MAAEILAALVAGAVKFGIAFLHVGLESAEKGGRRFVSYAAAAASIWRL